MTTEQREKMNARNAAIVAHHRDGHSIAECGRRFGLKRQRVQQILKKAGAWRPHEPSGRTRFVGVTVTEETKGRLEEMAEEKGTSVSRLTSDALDEMVKKEA